MVEKRLTQTKLSGLLGWKTKNAQYVSNIIRGKCQFPIKDSGKLCDVLGIELEVLIEKFSSDYRLSILDELYKNSEKN
jgi:transcriptional regulator with XRE-family HTH domain